MRSVFLPDWRAGNPYQSLLGAALERAGVAVGYHDLPERVFGLNRLPAEVLAAEVLHLHWVNSLIGPVLWSPNALKRTTRLALLAADVLLLRLRGKRVVWTIHNLVAHESRNPALEIVARRLLARCCSHLILHSHSALERLEQAYRTRLRHKANVIPHGNYDGCYLADPDRTQQLKQRFGITEAHTTLLFFGAVREYKGVLKLIEAFSAARGAQLRLLIAGNANPPALQERIVAAAKADARILTWLGFVDDEWVAPLFALCDVVVVPFERTLTSGSTVLAMTLGKATLLADEARVFDLVDDSSALFFDTLTALTAAIEGLDKAGLVQMGVRARRAAERLDWGGIAKATRAAYISA